MTAPDSKELGETTVAKELVPGEVATIDANVRAFEKEGRTIDGMYGSLRGVRTPGWSGDAALAWEGALDTELEKWKAYISFLDTSATALTTYASALTSAQSKAQTAIDKWEEGERATERALTEHNSAVDAYNEAIAAPMSMTPGIPPSLPPRPGPFVDAGQALRK
jgi:uncharacterized protein YukE